MLLTSLQIIDFAIWLMFAKPAANQGKVQHLLCQGFRRDVTSRTIVRGENAASSIPGVLSVYPNTHVTSMKAWPWPQVLALMGKAGERVMVDLVLDTGVFLTVSGGYGTYHQLSGKKFLILACFHSAHNRHRLSFERATMSGRLQAG